jgi:hypothetical protein
VESAVDRRLGRRRDFEEEKGRWVAVAGSRRPW